MAYNSNNKNNIVVVFDFDKKTIIDVDSDNWVIDELGFTDLFNQLLPTMPWNTLMVSEEVERVLAKLAPSRLTGSYGSSLKRIGGSDGRNLQLHFKSRLTLPLFTGGRVEGEQGPEASMKLDVVVQTI